MEELEVVGVLRFCSGHSYRSGSCAVLSAFPSDIYRNIQLWGTDRSNRDVGGRSACDPKSTCVLADRRPDLCPVYSSAASGIRRGGRLARLCTAKANCSVWDDEGRVAQRLLVGNRAYATDLLRLQLQPGKLAGTMEQYACYDAHVYGAGCDPILCNDKK